MGAQKKKPRRWRDLREDVRPEDRPKLDALDLHFRGVQEKHHPGSLNISAGGFSFLFNELRDDDDV